MHGDTESSADIDGSPVIVVGNSRSRLSPRRLLFVPAAIAKDQGIPVLRRLKELSHQDGTLSDLRTKGQTSALVFSPDVAVIALLPMWTAQATLLDISGVDCGNVTREERKEFLYMHLYYSKAEIHNVRKALNGHATNSQAVVMHIRPH